MTALQLELRQAYQPLKEAIEQAIQFLDNWILKSSHTANPKQNQEQEEQLWSPYASKVLTSTFQSFEIRIWEEVPTYPPCRDASENQPYQMKEHLASLSVGVGNNTEGSWKNKERSCLILGGFVVALRSEVTYETKEHLDPLSVGACNNIESSWHFVEDGIAMFTLKLGIT